MSSPVRAWIRRALQLSVVAPLALTACGPDLKNSTAFQCEEFHPALTGLELPVIPDVMELRTVSNRQFNDPASRSSTSSSRVGVVCLTANDKPTCEAAFATLEPGGGFAAECSQLCVDYHLATTRGDTVTAVATLEQLKNFLGPIDTPQEAMLIAFANRFRVSCDDASRGSAKSDRGGWQVIATSGHACGEGTALIRHYLHVSTDGELTEERSEVLQRGMPGCAIGRRPAGLSSRGVSACDEAVGRHFAQLAHLEAASVPAFEQLHDELSLHGAPVELRRDALRSALDEFHHTKLMTGLSHRFGAHPEAPQLSAFTPRSLLSLARDNAVEGCVRETFGALVAQYQARHAEDAEVRATMTRIAEDETRHAELSWAIDAWAMHNLSAAERVSVHLARRRALEALREEVKTAYDPDVARLAGLPSPQVAAVMLDALFAEA
ncbi:MAG: ferritin [Archangium gephyra]|uniref:Ferritin n=1 Tax=Archangium gephyra TaxID=48 RepID=A0A2W5UJX2_9BACT|nr:MAG: ferritin [Archangium gephyra]